MTESVKFFITVGAALLGSGLGTTIVGAFFKKRFDAQLEIHKALLGRGGRIHERQVETLLSIHASLDEALFYLQRAASPAKFSGEASNKVLLERMAKSLGAASQEFSKSRLLVSESLGQKLEEFFGRMFSGGMNINLALDPMIPDGEVRAKFWDEARVSAFKDLPLILKAIRDEARTVIHG